jgi:integrase
MIIPLPPRFGFRNIGGHMPRDRHQKGYVRETGKVIKKWTGFYHVYVISADGKERKKNKAVVLGLKSHMKKWEAEEKLARVIEKETGVNVPAKPDPELTFGWFWKNRFLPLKEGKWRRSTHDGVCFVIDNHVLPRFEKVKLCELNKFEIQMHLNELAKKYSKSLVGTAYTYLKAALEEALEEDFLNKNPMRKVEFPKTRRPSKRNHSPEEIQKLIASLPFRDRVILHCLVIGALRPGELFALRWKDIEPGRVKIDEAVYRNRLGEVKTEGSNGYVVIPQSLEVELAMWKASRPRTGPDDFVFESRYHGRPMDGRNYLRRFLKANAKEQGIEGLTFQSLRRTFATQVQKLGTVKDAQTQLRHADPTTTLGIYTQEIPESVRETVEKLDQRLFGVSESEKGRVN